METVIWVAIITSVSSLLVGLYNGFISYRRFHVDANSVNAKTIRELSEQVDELVEDKAKMNARISFLESELRRFTNGYSRAMRFIQRYTDINVPIPDFLESDPDLKPKTPDAKR